MATHTTQNKKSRIYYITCNYITAKKVPANASATGRKSWDKNKIFAQGSTMGAVSRLQIKEYNAKLRRCKEIKNKLYVFAPLRF